MKNKNYNDYKGYSPAESGAVQGGYRRLPFFQQTEIIYDLTVEFVKKYIDFKSRTKDQMEQAARSGKQNIAEGYLQKSMEGRIKLVGVARGSLEELLNDYQDFLRQRGLKLWEKDSSKSQAVRRLVYNRYNNYKNYIEEKFIIISFY